MKEFWVLLDDPEKASGLADGLKRADVIVSQRLSKKDIERLIGTKAKVASPSEDSDIRLLREEDRIPADLDANKPMAIIVEIASGRDEQKVADSFAKGAGHVILRCKDWKVIPLENIIAKESAKGKVFMEVASHGEAKLALETLELGSDGVVLTSTSSEEILKTSEMVRSQHVKLELAEVEVTGKKEVGIGARACVDTTELMVPGEGLLVGCQSNALFLVQAEVEENPFVESRPFRVNAGPVSLYVLSAGNKTNYLSELEAGREVLIVNREGRARLGYVGRVKIERRPMVLVEAQWQGRPIRTILQDAETVRLVTKDGSKSVPELEAGSPVLARVEEGGRHFGRLVAEESIIER